MIAALETTASYLIPRRIKKLWMLSSIAPVILNKKPDSQLASDLNAVFDMANNSESLRFPMEYASRYWAGLESNEASTDLRDRAVELAPKWLRYGDASIMKNDITLLLAMNH